MKTLSEDRDDRIKARQDERASALAWLTEIEGKDIPLYTSERYGSSREALRDKVRDESPSYNPHYSRLGVACDHCGTELINRTPGVLMTSNPPKINIGCIGCGWIGYSWR